MSELTRAQVCAKYGLADRELVAFADAPGGFTFSTSDGVSMIDVPAGTPDADGKTGIMYLVPPNVSGGYRGDVAVFTNPPDETPAAADDSGGDDLVDLSKLTKAQLVAYGAAQEPPVVIDDKLNKTEILTALADAAAAAADDGGDE